MDNRKKSAFGGLWALILLLSGSCKEEINDDSKVLEKMGEEEFFLSSEAETKDRERRASEVDPQNDGWLSELLHDRTNTRLKELGERLVRGTGVQDFLAKSKGADGSRFNPDATTLVYKEGGLQVKRANLSWSLRGTGLEAAFGKLGEEVEGGTVRFKQFAIGQVSEGIMELETSALVWLDFKSGSERVLRNMKWDFDWDLKGDSAVIKGVEVSDWEEARFESGESTIFRDRTIDLIGGLDVFGRQVAYGANEWVSRLSGTSSRRLQGITLGDLNGDGRDDVFCPQPDGLPNLVFVSNPDGGLEEKGVEWGLDWLNDTVSALIADFDNDGRQDLAVALSGRLVFLKNRGEGKGFEAGPEFEQDDSSAVCAADVNGDGLLDVFIGNYEGGQQKEGVVRPDEIYNATNGSPNRFYLNEGGFRFRDATKECGFDVGVRRMTLAASWEDFDADGDPDLYVANDFGPNCLYRNEGGKFTEVAAELGAEDPSTGMSVSWGDVNRDGRFDAIVGNMFSAAGNRVTSQKQFRKELREDLDVERVRYLARGNTFLVNQGAKFSEESESSGIINTQWTWSMVLADINNDSREDILAANGFVTGPEAEDL